MNVPVRRQDACVAIKSIRIEAWCVALANEVPTVDPILGVVTVRGIGGAALVGRAVGGAFLTS